MVPFFIHFLELCGEGFEQQALAQAVVLPVCLSVCPCADPPVP